MYVCLFVSLVHECGLVVLNSMQQRQLLKTPCCNKFKINWSMDVYDVSSLQTISRVVLNLGYKAINVLTIPPCMFSRKA